MCNVHKVDKGQMAQNGGHYEALWQLASLAAKLVYEYTPKMGRTYQQQCTAAVTSSYSYSAMPISVWRSIDRPVLMPKLRSLAWLIHAGGYKTADGHARFTNTSPVCPRCQQTTESVEHALVECREVYVYWSRFYQVISSPQYSQPNTCSILSLHIARNQRGQLNVKACSLALACGLWVIHRARLRRHFSQTYTSTLMLLSEWKWMMRDILIAKRRTAMERNTLLQFNSTWKCLLDITDLSVLA
jgi:hypothetical protein